jgi:hypothetical protein
VKPVSLPAGTVGTPISVSDAFSIAITPDGQTAYVTNGSGDVTPIALATNTPGSPIQATFGGPGGIAISTQYRQTSTSVTCMPGNVLAGQSMTCTATVSDTDTGTASTPSGTVRFASDGQGSFTGSPCVLSGSNGIASCRVTYTPTAVGSGQHKLHATYASSDRIHFATSARTSVAVAPRAASTSLSCSPSSTLVLGSTTCTVTVTDTDAGAPITPTGNVSFAPGKTGKLSPASCTLSGSGASAGCQVSYTPTAVGNGQQSISASYAGDSAHAAGTAQTIVQVIRRSISAIVICQQSTLAVGQTTTCTATITDTAAGQAITPTGTVKFKGTKNDSFADSPCALTGSNGAATCQVSYMPLAVGTGQHTISATYKGDRYHQTGSGQIKVTVTPPGGTLRRRG